MPRPRPLDINKKLPIVKSVKDFEDDEVPTSTRNSQILRLAAEADNEQWKLAREFPLLVSSYLPPVNELARGPRAEIGEFEYDLDNEDEDWLHDFNKERKTLVAEKLETIIFKLEVLDHKARERAGVITPTLGSPIPVLLTFDAAVEMDQRHYKLLPSHMENSNLFTVTGRKSVNDGKNQSFDVCSIAFNLYHLNLNTDRVAPPPPVNDTNPYNVFRPREKAHRLHTRRMQRRENNVQSFEKLRQVRRNLDQAKTILEALIKREEKKRELVESEVTLQRIQMKYKHETELLEDSLALPGLPSFPSKVGSSEEEFFDSDDVAISRPHSRPVLVQNPPFTEPKLVRVPAGNPRRGARRCVPRSWLHKLDPNDPVMLFTKSVLPDKLAAAGIIPPSNPSTANDTSTRPFNFHGRIGRGGRIVFDRWNPLMQTPIECGDALYVPPPKPRHSAHH
ncbi:hypothetical protein DH2020_045024 [Rehmannia glutinosa]|uniref:Enhancer of polycomb-like protein n=1 Tax=Rehmannia glutinosa TaxID=99300 RepID=A0ABR0UFC0_REHGL